MSLTIAIEGKYLDLLEDEIITLTLQSSDLIGLTGAKANFSKTIKVPATLNNLNILGPINLVPDTSDTPRRRLETLVLNNGFPIFQNATTIIESSNDDDITITIYSGNIVLNDLLAGLTLNDLDYGADVEYTAAEAAARAAAQSGLTWPVYDSRSRPAVLSINNAVDIRFLYPCFYVRSIIDAIQDLTGITIEGLNALETPIFNRLVMPLLDLQISEDNQAARGFNAVSTKAQNINTVPFSFVNVSLDESISGTEFDFNFNRYVSPFTFRYKLIATVRGRVDIDSSLFFRWFVQEQSNLVEVRNESIITSKSFDIDIEFESNYPANFAAQLQASGNGTIDRATVLMQAQPEAVTTENGGSLINVARSLPRIFLTDFITFFRQYYLLTEVTDTFNRKTIFTRFEDLVGAGSVDWSDKLDLSKDYSVFYRRPGYGQNNKFDWSEDDTIGDFSGTLTVPDENRQQDVDFVTTFFAACDEGENLGDQVATINLFEETIFHETEMTVNVGGNRVSVAFAQPKQGILLNDQVILSGGQAGCVVSRNETGSSVIIFSETEITPGTFPDSQVLRYTRQRRDPRILETRGRSGSIQYSNGSTNSALGSPYQGLNFKSGQIDLSWSEALDKNYNRFEQSLQNDKLVRAFFNLTESDVAQFKPNKLVFVEFFGATFYVNKIDRYRDDQSTMVELLRSIGTA